MESDFLMEVSAWLSIAGAAASVRVVCYAMISALMFAAGMVHRYYRGILWGLAAYYSATLFVALVLSMERSDILMRQRGFITLTAVYVAVACWIYAYKDLKASMDSVEYTGSVARSQLRGILQAISKMMRVRGDDCAD